MLRVISSSPGELEPVFEAMLANAVRLCEAKFGNLFMHKAGALRVVASHNVPPAYAETLKRDAIRPPPGGGGSLGEVIRTKQTAQIADLGATQAYTERSPSTVSAVETGGVRTTVAVPLLKDDQLLGIINIYRQEVRPFTDKQVALITNFAAQAVIAIENTRLLNELRQRTDDLTESLAQQTATSQVLRVIAGSSGELGPVFEAVLANAVQLCDAKFGTLYVRNGDALRIAATYGAQPEYVEHRRRNPLLRPRPETMLGQAMATRQPVQIADMRDEADYAETAEGATGAKLASLAGARTSLSVPILREGESIGAIIIFRREISPFTEQQVALVTSFAAQAVIAIENTRLLNELRQRTEELDTLNQQLEQRVADQVGEIERIGRLRRFLPPQVADLIVASGTEKQLESHRREITALRGFTGFSESADPEDVMALLREYHSAIGKIIYKHGGTLERFAGDGVMVIFNDPVPLPNPALVAVMMALEMRSAIEELVERWRRLGHELGFGISMAQQD